jgi:hypothetical protein
MSKDTGRADYQRSQAKLLAERNTQKPLEGPQEPNLGLLTPQVGKDTTKSLSEAE